MQPNEMRRQLEENGFFILPEVLSKAELERVRAGLDRGVEITRELRNL